MGPRIAWLSYFTFTRAAVHDAQIQGAILNALLVAPNLEPYFVWMMTPAQRADAAALLPHDHLTVWMRNLDITVVPWVLSFWKFLAPKIEKSPRKWMYASLDLPLVAQALRGDFARRGLMETHFLKTDADVLFTQPPPVPGFNLEDCGNRTHVLEAGQVAAPHPGKHPRTDLRGCLQPRDKTLRAYGLGEPPLLRPGYPLTVGVATEGVYASPVFQAGVIYFHLAHMAALHPEYVAYLEHHWEQWGTEDQGLLQAFFTEEDPAKGGRGRCTDTREQGGGGGGSGGELGGGGRLALGQLCGWSWLAEGQVNAHGVVPADTRGGWMGPMTGQSRAFRAAIWHWPTFKPNEVRCYLRAMGQGRWRLSRMNEGYQPREDKGGLDPASGCPPREFVGGGGAWAQQLRGCSFATFAYVVTEQDAMDHITGSHRFVDVRTGSGH